MNCIFNKFIDKYEYTVLFLLEAPPLIEAPPKIVKKQHEELRKSAPKCVKNNLPYHLDQRLTADIEH